MSEKRLYVPILTRVLVARRQLRERGIYIRRPKRCSLTVYFETMLYPALQTALGSEFLEWEHNPALGLRKKVFHADGSFSHYIPRENDHRYIHYMTKAEHLQKTVGRQPDAEKTVTTKGSDVWLMKKFRRLEEPPKFKQRIRSRGFARGQKRKIVSRRRFQ